MGSFSTVPDLPNRQIVLRRRPNGAGSPDDTELITAAGTRAGRR